MPQIGGSACPVQAVWRGSSYFSSRREASQQTLCLRRHRGPTPRPQQQPGCGEESTPPSPERTAHLCGPAHPLLRILDPPLQVGLGSPFRSNYFRISANSPSSGVPAGQGSRQLRAAGRRRGSQLEQALASEARRPPPLTSTPKVPSPQPSARPGPGQWEPLPFCSGRFGGEEPRSPQGDGAQRDFKPLGGQGVPSPASDSLARLSASPRRRPFLPRRAEAPDPWRVEMPPAPSSCSRGSGKRRAGGSEHSARSVIALTPRSSPLT